MVVSITSSPYHVLENISQRLLILNKQPREKPLAASGGGVGLVEGVFGGAGGW